MGRVPPIFASRFKSTARQRPGRAAACFPAPLKRTESITFDT